MKRIFTFAAIIFIYFLANYYVFRHINILIEYSSGWVKNVFFLLYLFLPTSFIVFFLFVKKLPVYPATLLYKISTGWMIILVYSFLLFFLLDIVVYGIRQLQILPSSFLIEETGVKIVLVLLLFIGIYGHLNYLQKRRIKLKIKTSKKLDTPLKIVMISDLHLGFAIRKKELKEWIRKINEEKPDLLLIAGDIIDNSVRPLNYYHLEKYFKEIKAPLGTYACLGNHEYLSNIGESISFINKTGIQLLRDSSVLVNQRFYIVGRDDRTNPARKSLSELCEGLDRSKPVILLDHQPYHLEEAQENGIDLQLSGHTHRGQVWPLSLIADAIYEDSHGYLKKRNTHIYVSSGIGIWGGRYRIGTQSEYVVIEFSSKNEA
ncbi:metallophosphoesterase [Apibacter raozihei]|uniref:metallophosphoesterase n=1 Tax=Apibacter raozihei TaxID=2500547 RepID=UPI000FE35C11|nr:metallophosphoesterase [Apibacter raozihei]